MNTLTQSQFQAAFQHGAVQSVAIEPSGAMFAVKFLTLNGNATLVQARKPDPRLFGTVDSALRVLHKLGVRRIVLDRLDQWHPDQVTQPRRTRPDRAEALNRAADYDRWVNSKVQASREDPRPDIADDAWQRLRAEKRAQQAAFGSKV